ncbi:MAG: SRPBCC family protein [Leeuwenhoekiella sp.]|nr:SRPBCC family protein [Leeuwenhoekiella sp.]
MKILKYLFFLLLILFIAGAIFFATKDGNYEIEETQIIKAPIDLVFNKVNDYRSWENWGPWKKEDPTMVFNYPEKTSGEGASYSWNGEEVDGSMRTTSVIENQRLEQDITFITPAGERNAHVYWQFEEVDGGTKVTWGIRGEHTLMDKAYFTIMSYDFDADMRTMYKSGLTSLDESVLEDMQVYTIKTDGITQYSGGFYMYVTTSTTIDAARGKIKEMIPQVHRYMEGNNITISGKPLTIYNSKDTNNNSAIISSGIPTTSQIIVAEDSTILCGFMPSYSVIKTTLKGDYKNLKEAWNATEAYLVKNNFTPAQNSYPFEIYVVGPEDNPNPAAWITELYIPVTIEDTLPESL